MRPDWKDLFAFTSGERNGIIVLLILLCFPLVFLLWPRNLPEPIEVVFVDVSPKTDSLNSQEENPAIAEAKKEHYSKPRTYATRHNKSTRPVKKFEPFEFNPNDSASQFWEQVGFSPKQQQSIINYLAKGGSFSIKSDVKKLYVVSDSMYAVIHPFILLPDSVPIDTIQQPKKPTYASKYMGEDYENLVVSLNSCDTTQLIQLRGIGSYSAKKIIRYREQLGGFVDLNQLFEIKGLREETIVELLPKFRLDSVQVAQFDLNKATASQMVKHPYFTWHMAKEIEGQRKFGKKYKQVSDLLKYGLLDEQLYIKIVPYVKL
jgi:DNA uptake protein ComE-like DNA-binding protein